jgi:response regulator NasT
MAYLVKPFQRKDLLPAIEMAVSRFAELVALEKEVGDLSGRLEARKLVDRAKAVLQTERGMTEPEAFRYVQRRSMDERRSMRAIAQEVLEESDKAARPSPG